MELFAMGFVDSEGNLVEENVLRDAQRTAALTAKIMKEKSPYCKWYGFFIWQPTYEGCGKTIDALYRMCPGRSVGA